METEQEFGANRANRAGESHAQMMPNPSAVIWSSSMESWIRVPPIWWTHRFLLCTSPWSFTAMFCGEECSIATKRNKLEIAISMFRHLQIPCSDVQRCFKRTIYGAFQHSILVVASTISSSSWRPGRPSQQRNKSILRHFGTLLLAAHIC